MAVSLVTGVNGFIGSHLAGRLVAAGHQVIGMCRVSSRRGNLAGLDMELRHADVTDSDAVRRALDGVEVVYHVAGLVKARDEDSLQRVNRGGTTTVADAAIAAGVRRMVLISSISAAGPAPRGGKLVETDEPHPVSAYGRSKRAGEVELIRRADRIEGVIVRPPGVYGPRDTETLQVFQLARRRLNPVVGFRDMPFSWIHARDLAAGIALAGAQGRTVAHDPAGGVGDGAGIYFFEDGEDRTWTDFGRDIGALLGKRVLTIRTPGAVSYGVAALSETIARWRGKVSIVNRDKAREATASSWHCSAAKARAELGWAPRISQREGFAEVIAWARAEGLLR